MNIEQLEKRLEFWKRGLLVALGASLVLLVTTLVESLRNVFGGWWYFMCVIIWLAVAPPGFYLLMSRKWRKVLLSNRLNVAFGYLGCAWLVLFNASIRDFQTCNRWILKAGNGEWMCSNTITGWNSLALFTAIGLGTAYWYLRKKKDKPEEMFP